MACAFLACAYFCVCCGNPGGVLTYPPTLPQQWGSRAAARPTGQCQQWQDEEERQGA